jgi:hypothetical protein
MIKVEWREKPGHAGRKEVTVFNFSAMVHQSTQKLGEQFRSSEIPSVSNRSFENG